MVDLKTKKRLMAIRTEKKKRQPSFDRVESWRYKKVKPSWRKARGIDNKTRQKMKMGVKSPEPGYGTPKAIRGLHPSGLQDVVVIHKEDLDTLSPKVHGIRISSRLGSKKKLDLIDLAREKGFRILNMGISRKELSDLEIAPIEEKEIKEEKVSSKKKQIAKKKEKKTEETPEKKSEEDEE